MITFERMVEAYQAALALLGAASAGMAWWRSGSEEEDKVIVEANEIILNALSDADFRRKVGVMNGREAGEDLTVEEVMEMRREVDLRRFGPRRN